MWDIFKRMSNAVFTASENYGVKVNLGGNNSFMESEDSVNIADTEFLVKMGLSVKEATDVIMQASLHEGAHIKLSKPQPMQDLVASAQNAALSPEQTETLANMANIVEDHRVDTTIARKRPGYLDLRAQGNKIAVKMFKDNPSGNKVFDTMKAVSFSAVGIDLREHGDAWKNLDIDWDNIPKTAEDLKAIAEKSTNTEEAIESTYEYYNNKYCDGKLPPMIHNTQKQSKQQAQMQSQGGQQGNQQGKPESGDEGDDSDGDGEGSSGKDASDKDGERKGKGSGEGKAQNNLGKEPDDPKGNEFATGGKGAGSGDLTPEQILKSFEGKNGALQKMMGESAYKKLKNLKNEKANTSNEQNKRGYDRYAKETREKLNNQYKNMWTPAEEAAYIPQIAADANAGSELMYLMHKNREYETKRGFTDIQQHGSRESFSAIQKRLDGEARILGAKLAQELRASRDDKGEVAKSGNKLLANKLWKPTHVGTTDVFWKPEFTEVGGYVVDLLLDASGSQSNNRFKIREQAYIIAEACSIAGITCRVTQFSSSDYMTNVICLKNYDEGKEFNRHVFAYRPGGDNRDGVAIRTANIELQKRPEQNKIFMILSDGSPANASGKAQAYGGVYRYNGSNAVKDVNKAVREIRASGTAVMGVYVASDNSEDTLRDEMDMYGNDFAHITDMKTFVPTVMRYLSKHIRSFEV